MRASIYITLSLMTLLSSCVTNTVLGDAHAAENSVNRLSRVSLRMDQEAVLQIMHAPYDKEVFRVGNDQYDVWFYITTITVLDQSRMVPKNLTPLTFRNRRLVGVGYDYYNWLKRRDRMSQQSVSEEGEALENEGLEIELQKSIQPGKTSTPPGEPSQNPQAQPKQPSPQQTPPPTPKPSPAPKQPPANQPKNPNSVPPNQQPNQMPGQPTTPSTPSQKPPPSQPAPAKPKTVTMSKPPAKEKAPPPSANPNDKSDEPGWDKKDEEINEESMDQDFDFW
jgi:hypothetical protein